MNKIAEHQANRYWQLREAGICPKCGKRKPKPGKSLCEECLARVKKSKEKRREKIRAEERARYYWYVSHHICTCCKKNEAEPGKRICAECQEKKRLKRKPLSPEAAERLRIRNRERAKERKEKGICVACGKHKALSGKTLCLECYLKNHRRQEAYRRRKGIFPHEAKEGRCYLCGEPVVPGKKVCAKHYASLLKRIDGMNKKRKRRKEQA